MHSQPQSQDAAARLAPWSEVRRGADWARWRDLAADAPPYLAPEFFALSRPLVDGGEPLVAEAFEGGRLVGALPLALDGDTLGALRSDHTPDFDYYGAPDGVDAIWRALRGDRRWRRLVLKNVPDGSPLATRLPELARHDGFPSVIRAGAQHCFFALPGFEARMSPRFLTNLRRCERKAGGVALETLGVPTHAALNEALAIEAMAWKGAAGTSITADPRVAHLYRALARLYGRRGRAHLYFLRADGKRVATLLAVEDAHTLYALKIGYDPRYAAVSPGHLMIWKVAADAEGRGLAELDLIGHDDDWKRKWTDRTHRHVSVVVYRRSLAGLLAWALHEGVKPTAAGLARELRSPLRRGCQRNDFIGAHAPLERLYGRVARGLGIRSGLKRALARKPPPSPTLGAPSRFPPGTWVRVRDEAEVRATLDERSRLRGLWFVPSQFDACGKVYRVQRHVRRIRDDAGRFRPVSRTVLLERVDCTGDGPVPEGCGRHCPLLFRDEWLAPAEAPKGAGEAAAPRQHARVRSRDEIEAGLDLHGRRDGLGFMPEMARFCGKRVAVAGCLSEVFEYGRLVPTRAPIYRLAGASCSGTAYGAEGPCDRACALLWHADWLQLEPPAPAP